MTYLYIDNAEIFYRVAEDHIKLADFLYRLHNKGVNWLMLEYDIPEIRQLYIEFQICQFTEDNEGKEIDFLFIFNCNMVKARKAYKKLHLEPLIWK